MMDAATKMITVRTRGKTEQRQVMYDDKTAFTFRNKPAKVEEVKEGRRVIVLGRSTIRTYWWRAGSTFATNSRRHALEPR